MATGDVELYGPADVNETASVQSAFAGNSVVVADTTHVINERGRIWLLVIKA